MAPTEALFANLSVSAALELELRRMNPWWEGKPMPVLPPHRRHLVGQIRRRMASRLAPIVVVRGARQIGKTTSQLQVLSDLLDKGLPGRQILRVQFDDLPSLSSLGADPIAGIVTWFERTILGETLNQAAHAGRKSYLFFDEVQNLPAWAPQLKNLVDSSTTQVVVTGSSALRLGLGNDSLAGRISTIEAGVLSLTEIAALRQIDLGEPLLPDNGLSPLTSIDFWKELCAQGEARAAALSEAFSFFSARGGYPLGHARPDVSWPELADQLNENVIRRVIQHDLRLGERGRRRDPQLLEEVFRLACRFAGQAPPIHTLADEVRAVYHANLGDQRVRQYLRFLADSLLIRAIEPLEIRLKKKRGSQKLCLVDHALRASWLQEVVPLVPSLLADRPALATLAGRLAESVVGAVLSTIVGLDLAHVPARNQDPEVDFVLTIGTLRIPIEVKYQATPDVRRDTEGLRVFLDAKLNNAPFGVLVTQRAERQSLGSDIVAVPLPCLMLMR